MSRLTARNSKLWILYAGGLALFLAFLLSSTFAHYYTDFLWFQSVGYASVFTTRLGAAALLTTIAVIGACAYALLNLSFLPHWLAPKAEFTRKVTVPSAARGRAPSPEPETREITMSTRPIRLAFTVAAVVIGLGVGLSFSGQWRTYLLAHNSVPFDLTDPVFNLDLSYYVFNLPWYQALVSRFQVLAILTLVGALARYALMGQLERRRVAAHLSVLASVWLIAVSLGRLLSRYGLLQAHTGAVFGAGYTDVRARLPLLTIEAVLFALAALVLLVNAGIGRWKLLLAVGIAWVALLFIGPLYPTVVQRLTVEPNEFVLEKPYIEHNIRFTRYAYGLESIVEDTYPAEGEITLADLEANQDIIRNVRLWDYRPLIRTYSQLQEIRLYYSFTDVDVDRYTIDGKITQVMLSARELDIDKLADQAQTWINRHLIFTHGYGVALSPVNEVIGEGLPDLWIRDFPPRSRVPELEIERPEIYFGELTRHYALVNTNIDEFNYPRGDGNAYTRYDGADGVRLGGAFRRLLLASRFGSTQMLISPALSADSRILFHRTIHDRAATLAPMLWLDDDPYPVITEGRIVWLLDAYTWTDRFPYSEPVGGVNYIRNSVKITVDAYTGETNFYLIDPGDPIAAAYARIFPELFKPVEMMPQALRAHWRYPETLFLYQSSLYATYHMLDPQVFYNREDLWDIPRELVEANQVTMEPYYVTMRLPGSDEVEFLLIRPYVPHQRQNMVAWLYARCDGENYGELGVFKLPKDRLVYGPLQIEGRADQDPVISQQLSLWNQSGSRVLRGNLPVIPLEGTFLYVEPLYLEAAAGQLPELKRVIAAYDDRITMAPTLEQALREVILGEGAAASSVGGIGGLEDAVLQNLAEQALQHYQSAQACLARGDWACYGNEQAALEQILLAMLGQ